MGRPLNESGGRVYAHMAVLLIVLIVIVLLALATSGGYYGGYYGGYQPGGGGLGAGVVLGILLVVLAVILIFAFAGGTFSFGGGRGQVSAPGQTVQQQPVQRTQPTTQPATSAPQSPRSTTSP